MAYQNSRRFLNAFVEIEGALKTISKNTRNRPFYQLVADAANYDPFVREIAVELREYGDLRNAIVHERINDEPIAEPHDQVVERLEAIRDLLTTPPRVTPLFLRKVVTCECDEALSTVAKRMFEHSFSKIPVYRGREFVGLLTAEAITYWLADRISDQGFLVEEKVEVVLNYLDKPDNYRFVTQDCSLFDIIRLFDEFHHNGTRLQAVLISDDGTESGQLLGIITAFDLPRIYRLIRGKQ